MDERSYVERRRPDWTRLADILERASNRKLGKLSREELLDLGKLYRRVASDLSYMQANSANQDLIYYLNDLAGRAHGYLYADPPRRIGRSIITFICRGFPILFRAQGRVIAVAAAIFLLSGIFAAVKVDVEPSAFGKLVPAQFAQTGSKDNENRIKQGGGSGAFGIPATFASGIMTNNIYVSIRAFAGGVTFGAWTSYELIENGLMIGALGMRFSRKADVALGFWSLILPHGFIELLAIVIAGGAGLMLGWGLISPKNLSRWDSLRRAARDALPLMGGVVGMLVIAGCIEGFVTPSSLGPWVKIAFSGVTAIGCILYFGFAGRGVEKSA